MAQSPRVDPTQQTAETQQLSGYGNRPPDVRCLEQPTWRRAQTWERSCLYQPKKKSKVRRPRIRNRSQSAWRRRQPWSTATKSVVHSGGLLPGNVIYGWCSHSSRSTSAASTGEGTWLGSTRGRGPLGEILGMALEGKIWYGCFTFKALAGGMRGLGNVV